MILTSECSIIEPLAFHNLAIFMKNRYFIYTKLKILNRFLRPLRTLVGMTLGVQGPTKWQTKKKKIFKNVTKISL
jgi:hypothetical protein